jgi:hypothetical protein
VQSEVASASRILVVAGDWALSVSFSESSSSSRNDKRYGMAAIVCTEVRQKSALKQLGLKVFLATKKHKKVKRGAADFCSFFCFFLAKIG